MNRQRKVVITTIYNDLGMIVDTKAEELDLSAQLNLQPTCNNLATDTISRQAAIDVILADKIGGEALIVMNALGDGRLALTLNDACDRHIRDIEKLPSVQSKQLQVLANVLDGCPLTQPCDRMWKPEGWCKEHCKPGQQEPDAECWLKYAEVMTADDT